MSWETLVFGEIVFKEKTTDKDLELIKNYLEVYPEDDDYWRANKLHIEEKEGKTYIYVLSVNLTSHIDKKKIKKLLKKLKPKLVDYFLSLWYLDESDKDFDFGDDE